MKITLTVPNNNQVAALVQPWQITIGGPEIAEIAALADRLGFYRLTVGEHFLVPEQHLSLTGAHHVNASTMLGFLAGCTTRIRLGSNISLVPLQHPVVQAKQWAVLDWLSGGRADLVVGAGWMKAEFDALGVDFHTRGRRLDEYVAAMREMWTSDLATFQGEFVDFEKIAAEPKPVQPGGVPMWFAGDVSKTFARIAKWGTGWSPYQTPPQEIPRVLDEIRAHADYRGQEIGVFFSLATLRLGLGHVAKDDGRDFDPWNAQQVLDEMMWLTTLGVTDVAPALPTLDSYQHYLDWLHWTSEEIIPRLR